MYTKHQLHVDANTGAQGWLQVSSSGLLRADALELDSLTVRTLGRLPDHASAYEFVRPIDRSTIHSSNRMVDR